jgi:nitronate monooxygenase
MAGGPSTPQLAAAVNRGGGLGFLAAGYLTARRLEDDIRSMRGLDGRAFGVNVFVAGSPTTNPRSLDAYARSLSAEAERAGVQLGEPRFDDDAFDEKVQLLTADPVAVISFTFGAPAREYVETLQAAGSEVWVTVTSPSEAGAAAAVGADALIVQGVEAGGHRAVFIDDDDQSDLTLLAALQLVRATTKLPLIAAGAIMTGPALGAVLVAGASAGQIGTAFLRSVEAGTSGVQRDATATTMPTVLTRAFSGRTARGIRNRWHSEHADQAPRAYPETHHLTAPLRARGREVGDADLINLWAGQAHQLAAEQSAQTITAELGSQALAAISGAIEPEAR